MSLRRVVRHTLGWSAIASVLLIPPALAARSEPKPLEMQPQAILAQRIDPVPVPPLPNDIPEAVVPIPEGIVGLDPDADDELGIGHLRPADISSLEDEEDWTTSPIRDANWLQGTALPIYVEPNGSHWGWLINGWLVPNGFDPIAIGRDATFLMVRTDVALLSFPVLEIREDGWFRFQYTPAGTAWAHLSHLELGSQNLLVERWEDRFVNVGWVQFRNHGISQPLRPEPSSTGPIHTLVGPDSYIEAIAIDGNWMQVRVTQPTQGCTVLPGARTQEGWMRWRSEQDREILVWHPAKGC